MRLKNDIYIYEWTNAFDNNCNSYFIGGKVQALIDPGLTGYVPNLLNQMSADGIREEDIRYVINTHSHPDHFQGSEVFDQATVKIGLHKKEIEFLKGDGGELYGLFGINVPRLQVNFPMDEGDVIFDQSVGRTDFPGGNGALLKKSIISFSQLDLEWLLPGHMGIVSGKGNIQDNFNIIIQSIFPYI